MTLQTEIAAALEVSKADLGLGDAEDVFDAGPGVKATRISVVRAVLGGALATKYLISWVCVFLATISQ